MNRTYAERILAVLVSAFLTVLSFFIVTTGHMQPSPTPPVGQTQPATPTAKTFLPLVTSVPLNQNIGKSSGMFTATFDGAPTAPQRWQPTDWDISVHRRAIGNSFEKPMQADHGADCAGPPAKHTVQSFDEAVFICKNHLMTAIYAEDYGMIYLTPNQMVDFSNGEAVVRWDMSTTRTSLRDWVDLWITPYEDNLQMPLNNYFPDGNGEPRRSVQIKMDVFKDTTIFKGTVFKNFQGTEVESNWYTGYESFLTPDSARRDTFELRISRTHIKFGMPAYNFYWIDSDIEDLGWSKGVIQFGHHSYNPLKGCDATCTPNTWHWDNVLIDPAVPFTIIHGLPADVDTTTATTPVRFAQPAPADAHLRFNGLNYTLEVSFDNGGTWQPAVAQKQLKQAEDHFQNYWMPIPAGTSSVLFRRTGTPTSALGSSDWQIRDVSIWAPPTP